MISDQILALLKKSISVEHGEVIDQSDQHKGHAGARESGGGHYYLLLVSDDFMHKSAVERHRMIYQALKPIKEKIHALGIKVYTSSEYKKLSP
ncbi:MAG: BolA family transcriptional regulator [Candidatus Omnitrophica bacterium]|nr:BolA family transcriptional regulator [Candidatus Omnitrophota bacterium]